MNKEIFKIKTFKDFEITVHKLLSGLIKKSKSLIPNS